MVTQGTQNTVTRGDSLFDTSNGSTFDVPTRLLLDRLYKRVAPNAILNVGSRAGEVRCHLGTCEEIIGRIEKRGNAEDGQMAPMFRLSGHVRAGKSAILQTFVEQCKQRGVPYRPVIVIDSVDECGWESKRDRKRTGPLHANSGKWETRRPEDLKEEEDCVRGKAYRNLRAAFSKSPAMAETTDTTALRRVVNTLAAGDPFMEDRSHTEAEGRAPAKLWHVVAARDYSPYPKAVQVVENSVDTTAKSASQTPNHPRAARTSEQALVRKRDIITPMHSIHAPNEQLCTIHPFSMPPGGGVITAHHLTGLHLTAVVDLCDTPEFQAEYVNTDGRPSSILLAKGYDPVRIWDASTGSQYSPCHNAAQAVENSVDTTAKSASQTSNHPRAARTSEQALVPKPGPAGHVTTPMGSIHPPKGRLLTVHPLLMPPGGGVITAHRLASLYFTAVVDLCDIPEFRAEYINTDGRPSSILLTFKSTHDVDRLKELWDSIDREHSRVPKLAQVKLYRGNVSGGRMDM